MPAKTSTKFLVVGVFDDYSRISLASNVPTLIRQWRRRYGQFAVVGCMEVSGFAQWSNVTGAHDTKDVAGLLQAIPLDSRYHRDIFRQNVGKGRLVLKWEIACRHRTTELAFDTQALTA